MDVVDFTGEGGRLMGGCDTGMVAGARRRYLSLIFSVLCSFF